MFMSLVILNIDDETGLPLDKSYMERELPLFLDVSLKKMKETWKIIDSGEECNDWDCDFCDLQSSINVAEVENLITNDQAWYLREKYLGMEKNRNT